MNDKILVIEDNLAMRENIQEMLEMANYEVAIAINGKDGINKAKTFSPNLILCDIMMPKMDGYEVLYFLSKDHVTSGIPFVFLTAKSEKEDLRKGMNLGADDYLTKPFDDMELLNVVETRLNRSLLLRSEGLNTGYEGFIVKAKDLYELENLSADKKLRYYKKKEVLFHESDPTNFLYLVHSGRIKTYKLNEDFKEYITGLFKAGDYFGYIALLKDMEHPETAVAIEDSEIIKIHKDDFLSLIYNNREVAHYFIKMLSGNIVEKEQNLINLAYNSVRKRVADGLILLHKRYIENDVEPFTITLSRNDLASIVGTSTESVIRVLSDFKNEGLINIKGSKITVLNLNGLKLMHN